MSVIGLVFVAFVLGAGTVGVVWFFHAFDSLETQIVDLTGRVEDLTGENCELKSQVADLERSRIRRHTDRTAAGLMDLRVTTGDVVQMAVEARTMLDQARASLDYIYARAESTAEITNMLSQGPQAYDPDRPAGPRPNGRKQAQP